MNNSFLNKLTPHEPKFFPLLRSLSDVILKTSDIMIESIQNYSHEAAIAYYKKIKEQEKEGDRISNKIFDELNSTFITPFDREDINALANKLDDVVDHLNSCAKRIVLYNPKKMPDQAVDLASIIRESAISIGKAVEELNVLKKNPTIAKKHCSDLHDLENKADDVYENFIIYLFETEKDGIELIKNKEIMFELEKASDAADHVGKIIKTIIVKYA